MSRLHISYAVFIILLLTVVNLAARALGTLSPPNPILRRFTVGCEGQAQPCWNGIIPGVTPIADAQARVEAQGYTLFNIANNNLYFTNRQDGVSPPQTCSNIRLSIESESRPITSIVFTGCQELLVGDLARLGLPQKIIGTYIKMGDYFSTEIVEYEVVEGRNTYHEWSPFSKAASLYIGSATFGIQHTIESRGYVWRGFTPRWRFCALEPTFTGCRN